MLNADAKELRKAMGWVCQAIAVKPAQPILGAVVMTLVGDQLMLSGTDHEMAAVAHVPLLDGEGEQFRAWPTRVMVPGHPLRAMLDALDGNVSMAAETTLALSAGRRHFTLGRMDERTYPSVPADPGALGIIDGQDLRRVVQAVAPALWRAAAGGGALVGIHVVADEAVMSVVACDKYRAHQARVPWSGQPFSALVPGRRLADLVRSLEGPVDVMADDHLLGIGEPTRSATVGILASEYPNVETFWRFATDASARVLVNREELAEAVKAAAIVTERGVVDLLIDGPTITLTGDADGSGSDVEMTCDSDATQRRLRLNRDYLTDALAAMATPNVELLIPTAKPVPPVTVRGVSDAGGTDPTVTAVVMAIRPGGE